MNQDESFNFLLVEDHELFQDGVTAALKTQYPKSKIESVKYFEDAWASLNSYQPHLAIVDLSIPQKNSGEKGKPSDGIEFLKQIMQQYPTLNITVQSASIEALTRMKHNIDGYEAGFTIADKSLSNQEMLKRIAWSLEGVTHTRDLPGVPEFRQEWLEVLQLAFNHGLQDKAIAARMFKSERAIRNYWTKAQDALGVYPEEGKNIRIQTEIRARELGLID